MKVMLFFPPHWEPMMPHLALPSLAAYLRSHGVEVIQRDLNAEVFDQVLSGRHLRAVTNQLRRERRRVARKGLSEAAIKARIELTDWAQEEGKELARDVEWAKETVRSERFFDPEPSLKAFLTLVKGLRLGSSPYCPSELHFTGYSSAYPPYSSRAIRAATQDRDLNMFRNLLQVSVLPQIRREQPDLVGISLTSADQVIAGFTLASLVKEAELPTHVVLGGKMVTCWRDQLPHAQALWDLFDSAIVYEGEVALLRLVEALDRGQDLSSVPNLIYRAGTARPQDGLQIRINEVKTPEPAGALPIPDFGGLPLDLYLAPVRVLPVSASRGCYWGRCAFCNVGYGESCHFSEQRAEQVAEEMLRLAEAYGSRHFFFADEALSPRMLKRLSAHLIEADAHLDWACCARFEPGIREELLRQMRQAGCRMVLYGLESGSQRVLDRMDKGTRLEAAQRILEQGAEAGIWNHIFFFFGFPGETEEEAQETIRFFRANRHLLHSACTGTFLLERHARVADDPAAYGVSRLIPPRPEQDLAYYYEYEVASGIGPARAEEIEAAFLQSLPHKPFPQYYFHDIYRFLYACQFTEEEPLPTMAG
jgi:anaerobic magnesium-protoporphyrin IX monomethyl ester cyclase